MSQSQGKSGGRRPTIDEKALRDRFGQPAVDFMELLYHRLMVEGGFSTKDAARLWIQRDPAGSAERGFTSNPIDGQRQKLSMLMKLEQPLPRGLVEAFYSLWAAKQVDPVIKQETGNELKRLDTAVRQAAGRLPSRPPRLPSPGKARRETDGDTIRRLQERVIELQDQLAVVRAGADESRRLNEFLTLTINRLNAQLGEILRERQVLEAAPGLPEKEASEELLQRQEVMDAQLARANGQQARADGQVEQARQAAAVLELQIEHLRSRLQDFDPVPAPNALPGDHVPAVVDGGMDPVLTDTENVLNRVDDMLREGASRLDEAARVLDDETPSDVDGLSPVGRGQPTEQRQEARDKSGQPGRAGPEATRERSPSDRVADSTHVRTNYAALDDRSVIRDFAESIGEHGLAAARYRRSGLYVLESNAQSNPAERQYLVNLLCAYLRTPYLAPPIALRRLGIVLGSVGRLPTTTTAPTLAALVSGHDDGARKEQEVRLAAQRILSTHLRPTTVLGDLPETFWPDIDLDLTGATLLDLDLTGCLIRTVVFTEATFVGNVNFDRTVFAGDARFDGATFTKNAAFAWVKFSGEARFDGTMFTKRALFDGATFTKAPTSKGASFGGKVPAELTWPRSDAVPGKPDFACDDVPGPVHTADGQQPPSEAQQHAPDVQDHDNHDTDRSISQVTHLDPDFSDKRLNTDDLSLEPDYQRPSAVPYLASTASDDQPIVQAPAQSESPYRVPNNFLPENKPTSMTTNQTASTSRPPQGAQSYHPKKRPPQSGWRRTVHSATGGLVNMGESPADVRRRELIMRINQPLRGCYKIAVVSLKGGVGKTTTTTVLGSTFSSLRGDRVIAVDADPDRGTLALKVPRETTATVRHLLRDVSRITKYSDVRAYTSKSPSLLEVLASEQDLTVSDAFSEQDYLHTVAVLEHFYNIVLTDCGTGMLRSAMKGVLDQASSLVLVSSGSIDGAQTSAATLDWLEVHGYRDLVAKSVAVINSVRPGSGKVDLDKLAAHFASRCRAVVRFPFDAHLEEGAEIELDKLAPDTRLGLLELAATIADDFPN